MVDLSWSTKCLVTVWATVRLLSCIDFLVMSWMSCHSLNNCAPFWSGSLVNDWSQFEHLNGFSPVWISLCLTGRLQSNATFSFTPRNPYWRETLQLFKLWTCWGWDVFNSFLLTDQWDVEMYKNKNQITHVTAIFFKKSHNLWKNFVH